jgi:hypothetical protein
MTPSRLPYLGPARGSELDRRRVLGGLAVFGGIGLGGCVSNAAVAPLPLAVGRGDPGLYLAPLRASAERIFDISVCTRPFRPAGPRLDVETVGDARVVHNYGHGGSGWSLSWGSSAIAVGKALANSPRAIAVVGSGPLGLTSALLAQSAGVQVTIYAREIVPRLPSLRATGSFTPRFPHRPRRRGRFGVPRLVGADGAYLVPPLR